MFEVIAFAVFMFLLIVLVQGAYTLGVEDGWSEAGAWNDAHLLPTMDRDEIASRTRPASRHEQ